MKKNLFVPVLFLIAIFCICDVKSEIEERFKEDIFKIYKHIAIEVNEITNEHVTLDKIKYVLRTKSNPENSTEIDPANPEQLVNATVNIVFLIHGWLGKELAGKWYEPLTNAFLHQKEEYYVVQVDWTDPATQIYTVSSWNTKDIGHFIGEFVVGLHKNYSIPLENFLLVGHSLGGQVTGYAGKKVKEVMGRKLTRIVALDPAGPLFNARPDDERLNKNDAEVVEVIHTDGGTFGYKDSCGTIDFFPNGGSSQPGCKRIDLLDIRSVAEPVICDHLRSPDYFTEALLNPSQFLATKCDGWLQFKSTLCDGDQVAMGDLKTRETGDFYLGTNDEKPYGRIGEGSILGDALNLSPLKIDL